MKTGSLNRIVPFGFVYLNYAPPAASSLSPEDVALLRKFHALDDMAQARILNSLDFEYQAATRQECAESSISPA